MKTGNGGGRIITGAPEPEHQGNEDVPIPALNDYWVDWFNPIKGETERVVLAAHTVEIYEDGMLVFKAFAKTTNPELIAMGAPPVMGYYVRSFRNHISFGQQPPIEGRIQ
jgi:hypothetical protein